MADKPDMPKASDLLLGAVEFFAVIAPGLVAVLVIGWAALRRYALPAPEKDATLLGVSLVLAFILGHMLHGLGSFLDVFVYDPLFKPLPAARQAHGLRRFSYFRSNDALYRAAQALAGGGLPTGLYQWARAWLRIHSSEATMAVDRLEADSKFFRNLSVLCIATLLGWTWLPPERAGFFAATLCALVICLWRYCDLRQKMVRGCYLYYVLLHQRKES